MVLDVPFFKQDTDHTCGPTALQMLLRYYGVVASEKDLAEMLETTHEAGTRHGKLIEVAGTFGFFCYVNNDSSVEEIRMFLERGVPPLVHFTEPDGEEGHYAVVVGSRAGGLLLHDPWNGPEFEIGEQEFIGRWRDSQEGSTYRRWLMALAKEDFNIGRQYLPA